MDEQRRPEITVRDPAHPERPLEVLAYGDDEPARPSPFTRRRVVAALAAVSLLAGGVAAVELRERRTAAAEDRRAAAVVALTALDRPSRSSTFTGTGTTLSLVLRLRNDGPRPVRLLRGGAGGFGLGEEVELPPGRIRSVPLERPLSCTSPLLQEPVPSEVLELSVDTQAGLRRVSVPLPFVVGRRQDLMVCGDLPLGQSVSATVLGVEQDRRQVRLAVEIASGAGRPVDVIGISAGEGVRVELRSRDGFPVSLPLSLRQRGAGATVLEAVLTVVDCGLALTPPAEADLGAGQPLVVLLGGDDGERGQVEAVLPVDLVRALAERSCGSAR